MFHSVKRDLNTATHVEFLEDILNMNFDSALRQIMLAGNFLVTFTESKEDMMSRSRGEKRSRSSGAEVS